MNPVTEKVKAPTHSAHGPYIPAIDGLRAIAVLIVVFYHAQLGFLGGFVGVDVFFVISGYLITSIILRELGTGKFELAGFWERRIRRIIPAQTVILLAVAVAGYFVLLPQDLAESGEVISAQATMWSNLFFLFRGSYFNPIIERSPLLHMWSLSLEEQFYLFFPIALLAAFMVWRRRWKALITLFVLSTFTFSLGISIWLMARGADGYGFFSLPPRAWELLTGSCLALLPSRFYLQSQAWRNVIGGAGIVLIMIPALVYNRTTPFPALFALPPCLGAAMVIYSVLHASGENAPGRLEKWLSWKPLVFIGLISYSLYLWHQPVLSLAQEWLFAAPLSLPYRWGMVAVSFLLAVATWRWVERPFRRRGPKRWPVFVAGGAAILLLIGVGQLLYRSDGFPQRLVPELQAVLRSKGDSETLPSPLPEDGGDPEIFRMGAVDLHRPIEVAVMGDSHAMHSIPMLNAIFKERSVQAVGMCRTDTIPILYKPSFFTSGEWKKKRRFIEKSLSFLEKHKIRRVLLIGNWAGSMKSARQYGQQAILDEGFRNLITVLQERGCEIVVVVSIPPIAISPQDFDVKQRWRGGDESFPFVSKAEHDENLSLVSQWRRDLKGIQWIDLSPLLLDPSGEKYLSRIGDTFIYRDTGHLTQTAAFTMMKPYLEQHLRWGRTAPGQAPSKIDGSR